MTLDLSRKQSTFWVIFTLLFLTAACIRTLGLSKSVWQDEVVSINEASNQTIGQALKTNFHFPSYSILLRIWRLGGTSVEWMRSLSVLLGLATWLLMFFCLRSFGKTAAISCGLLMVLSPEFIRHSLDIRHYSLLLSGSAATIFLIQRSVSQGRCPTILILLTLLITLSSCALGIPAVLSLLIFWYLSDTKGPGQLLRPFSNRNWNIALWGLLILLLLVSLTLRGSLAFKVPSNWWMPKLTFRSAAASLSMASGFNGLVRGIRLWLSIESFWTARTIAFILLGAGLMPALYRSNKKLSGPFFWSGVSYLLMACAFSLLVVPITRPRVIMVAMLFVFAALSVAIQSAPRRFKAMSVVTLFIACILSFPHAKQKSLSPLENWKETTRQLNLIAKPQDLVVPFNQAAANSILFYKFSHPRFSPLRDYDEKVYESTLREIENTLNRGHWVHLVYLEVRPEQVGILTKIYKLEDMKIKRRFPGSSVKIFSFSKRRPGL